MNDLEEPQARVMDVGLQELFGRRAPDVTAAVARRMRAADPTIRPRRNATAAALFLLGCCVAAGVTMLVRQAEQVPAQEPAFDPVMVLDRTDVQWTIAQGGAAIRALPPTTALGVVLPPAGVVTELSERAQVQQLMLIGAAPTDDEELAGLMRTIAGLPALCDLRLAVSGLPALLEGHLRALRATQHLVSLEINCDGARLTAPVAQALCEIPRLRTLALHSPELDETFVRMLAGTPTLQELRLRMVAGISDDDLFTALGSLRTLRSLSVRRPGLVPYSAQNLAAIAKLPKLVMLDADGFACTPQTMSLLPTQLEGLRVMVDSADAVAALTSGLRQLRGLRGLWITALAQIDTAGCAGLAAALASLPLQRLSCRGMDGDGLSRMLESVPRVAELDIDGDRGLPAAVTSLRELARLTLHRPMQLTPTDLQPLRTLPRLRSVSVGGGMLTEAARKQLSGCLGSEIEVSLR